MLKVIMLTLLILSATACVTAPPPPSGQTRLLFEEAPPALVQAIQANPNSSEAWFQLGNAYADQDKLIKAEAAYRQALVRGPHLKAQHNLGLVHIRLGVEALRSAYQQMPADHPSRQQTRQFLDLMSKAGI